MSAPEIFETLSYTAPAKTIKIPLARALVAPGHLAIVVQGPYEGLVSVVIDIGPGASPPVYLLSGFNTLKVPMRDVARVRDSAVFDARYLVGRPAVGKEIITPHAVADLLRVALVYGRAGGNHRVTYISPFTHETASIFDKTASATPTVALLPLQARPTVTPLIPLPPPILALLSSSPHPAVRKLVAEASAARAATAAAASRPGGAVAGAGLLAGCSLAQPSTVTPAASVPQPAPTADELDALTRAYQPTPWLAAVPTTAALTQCEGVEGGLFAALSAVAAGNSTAAAAPAGGGSDPMVARGSVSAAGGQAAAAAAAARRAARRLTRLKALHSRSAGLQPVYSHSDHRDAYVGGDDDDKGSVVLTYGGVAIDHPLRDPYAALTSTDDDNGRNTGGNDLEKERERAARHVAAAAVAAVASAATAAYYNETGDAAVYDSRAMAVDASGYVDTTTVQSYAGPVAADDLVLRAAAAGMTATNGWRGGAGTANVAMLAALSMHTNLGGVGVGVAGSAAAVAVAQDPRRMLDDGHGADDGPVIPAEVDDAARVAALCAGFLA